MKNFLNGLIKYISGVPKCIFCKDFCALLPYTLITNIIDMKGWSCDECRVTFIYGNSKLQSYYFIRTIRNKNITLHVHLNPSRTLLAINHDPDSHIYSSLSYKEIVLDIPHIVNVTPQNIENKIKNIIVFS